MHMINFFTTIFPIFFLTIFVIAIGGFVFAVVRGLSEWNKNNHSPRLTVTARVVTKRADVSHHHHHNSDHMSHTYTDTTYYATFEVESGDRMELHVSGQEYGLLVEGDVGELSFQGTRYLGFARRPAL